MKKLLLITAMLGLSLMAIAGSVYGRKTVAALSNSGQATIQIDPAYAGCRSPACGCLTRAAQKRSRSSAWM